MVLLVEFIFKKEHSGNPTSTGLNIKNNKLRRDKRESAGGVGGREQMHSINTVALNYRHGLKSK